MIHPDSKTPRPAEPNEAKIEQTKDSSPAADCKGQVDTFDDRPERSIQWQDEIQQPAENEQDSAADAQVRAIGCLMRHPSAVRELNEKSGLVARHFPDRASGELWRMIMDRAEKGLPTDVLSLENDCFGLGTDDPAKSDAMRILTRAFMDRTNSSESFEEHARRIMAAGTVAPSTGRPEEKSSLISCSPGGADLLHFPDSDAGNAERFHALYGSNLRHVREAGKWIIWNGSRWVFDEDGEPTRLFVSTMRELAGQAVRMENPQAAQAKASFALRSTNRDKVVSGLALARSIAGVTVGVDKLDGDPWKVGTPDGVVDLKEGGAVPPSRGQLITKQIGTSYDPHAVCPLWENFIQTVTGGDSELAKYLQSAVGYSLTGLCREQCLFFLHGSGQNGKGVFSETIKRLFGDYAQTAPEVLFTKDRNSSATNDIARLAGVRLAIAAELEENASFAEARLKSLTGGDSITARFLHKEFFDFAPSHKFWISGNHKPTVRGTDTGIWRRLRLIPFTVKISEEEKDRELAEKLIHELPGILNWAIEGCQQWQSKGLVTPACVRRATEGYRREEDVVGQFLDDCTDHTDPEARTGQADLYNEYCCWADQQGIQPRYRLSARKLNKRVEEHGFARVKSNGGRFWEGVRICDS